MCHDLERGEVRGGKPSQSYPKLGLGQKQRAHAHKPLIFMVPARGTEPPTRFKPPIPLSSLSVPPLFRYSLCTSQHCQARKILANHPSQDYQNAYIDFGILRAQFRQDRYCSWPI